MKFMNLSMGSVKRFKCMKYSTILGCCLILMPNGIFWYWGNMSVYAKSYFVSVLNTTSVVTGSWVYSFYVVCWTLSMFALNTIAKRIGRKASIFIGILIFDTGIACGYFSVQTSLELLTFTMGVLTGIGTGLMDGSALQMVVDWSDNGVGGFTGLLQSSLSGGAVVINQLVSIYTNPNNLSPNYYLNPTKYFTQKEVLEKVPSMFLVLACFTVSLHLLGLAMVRSRPFPEAVLEDTPLMARGTGSFCSNCDKQRYSKELQHENSICNIADEIYEYQCQCADNAKHEKQYSENEQNVKNRVNNQEHKTCSEYANTIHNAGDENADYTCWQLLRLKSFYAIWISSFFCAMAAVLGSNYYKMFGQNWIQDDHLMANIGTTASVGTAVIGTAYGFSMDRFGVKNCIIVLNSSMALVLFWYYFSVMSHPWVFAIATVTFIWILNPVYTCYAVATALLYGKTHYTSNFGLVMTAQAAFNLISPFVTGVVLSTLGWFPTYASVGSFIILGTILSIILISDI